MVPTRTQWIFSYENRLSAHVNLALNAWALLRLVMLENLAVAMTATMLSRQILHKISRILNANSSSAESISDDQNKFLSTARGRAVCFEITFC